MVLHIAVYVTFVAWRGAFLAFFCVGPIIVQLNAAKCLTRGWVFHNVMNDHKLYRRLIINCPIAIQ